LAVIEHDIHDDDAALVLAVQAGDVEAYAELFRRHHPAVRRACARRLRNVADADEIAQAAFVRALERIDRCGGERRFGAWVQVIAQRLCIDAIRAQARTMPHEQPVTGDVELGPNAPEDHVLDLDRASTLREALSTLPPRQRDVVIARDVEERRPPEIAAALGLSIGAVDSLLLRARRRLAGAYRAAAGEQGVSTATSSAAVAGGTIAAGNRGFVEAVVAGVRAVRDAVLHLPSVVAGAPVVPPGARTAAAAAVVAALALGGAGGDGSTTTAPPVAQVPPVTSVVPTVPDLPAPPSAPAPPAGPAQPDLGSLVPAAPPVTTPPVSPPAVPAAPAAPAVPASLDHVVAPVADAVSDVVGTVTGATDTLLSIPPVG
jgi:RNA polymerase sigma-70 factor (ECF subfamily)